MTLPLTLPSAQCSCPSGNLLPLIVAGVAVWGLWRVAQWMGHWFAKPRSPRQEAWSNTARTVIVFGVLAVVILVAWGGVSALRPAPRVAAAATDRPRLVFLGAGRCRPCQAMEPVRKALRDKYASELIVEYHDVWKDPEPGHRFGIRTIPTTIFFGPDGEELLRRQGYLSEEDIVNKWRELGYPLKKGTPHVENE